MSKVKRTTTKKEVVKKVIKDFPFTLGADPEFNIIMNKKRVSAEHLFCSVFKKDKKLAGNKMGFEIEKAGSIGWDGNAATAEIRPAPCTTANKMTENLGIMFKAIAEHTQLFKLSTLSRAASVGGHIHFLLPDRIKSMRGRQMSVATMNIHKQLCSFYLPLLLGEDALNLRTRKNSNYGSIKDFRVHKPNENVKTLEFRVPTAEWLTTPKIAQATIAYMGTVYNEIINHPENLKKVKEILITSNAQAEALHSLSLSSFVFLTEALLNKIKKHIKTFEFYDQYKDEINFILNPKTVLKEKTKIDFNILEGWGLYETMKCNKKEFLSQKNVKEFGKKVNLEDMQQTLSIPYNDDDYVSAFLRELKYRLLSYKMKLDKNYFVFGLKKGFPGIMARNKAGEVLYGAEHIKSREDNIIIGSIFEKMDQRFYVDNSGNRRAKKGEEKDYILIGIPYETRVAENHEEFLSLIYDLEKQPKKYPAQATVLTGKPTRDVTSKIYTAYNVSKEEIRTEEIHESSAERNAKQQIHDEQLEAEDELPCAACGRIGEIDEDGTCRACGHNHNDD